MSETLELTPETTQAEMDEYIDGAVERLREEMSGGEEKSDSESIASESDDKDLAVSNSDSTDEPESIDNKETGEQETGEEDEEGVNARFEELAAEMKELGFDDDDLAGFDTPEEVENALAVARKAMATAKPEAGDDERGDAIPHKVSLDPDIYDEGIIEELNSIYGVVNSLVAEIDKRDRQSEEHLFDSFIDGLKFTSLFGETGKESEEELGRRNQVARAYQAQKLGLKQMGEEVPAMNQRAIAQMARAIFPDEFGKREIKNRTRRVSKQASRKMGDGSTKPTEAPMDIREEMRQLYKELDQS